MRTGIALVDLYLARGRVRAELNMQGYSRLSDLFNNAPGDFLSGTLRMTAAMHSDTGQPAISIERRELVVRVHDIRLVRPIEEHPSVATASAWRERTPVRVVMDLDDWQVTGDIYMVDRIPWLDFMTATRHRFISVSDASVRFVGVADTLECPFLLVNGARVSALYEAP
jgi:hypothetical protein